MDTAPVFEIFPFCTPWLFNFPLDDNQQSDRLLISAAEEETCGNKLHVRLALNEGGVSEFLPPPLVQLKAPLQDLLYTPADPVKAPLQDRRANCFPMAVRHCGFVYENSTPAGRIRSRADVSRPVRFYAPRHSGWLIHFPRWAD